MSTDGPPELVLKELPWAPPRSSQDSGASLSSPRPVLETPADVTRVTVVGAGEALVSLAVGERRRTWELPGTGAMAAEGDGAVVEPLRLELRTGGRAHTVELRQRGLPRPIHGQEEEEPSGAAGGPWTEAADLTEGLIARHVEAIYDTTERTPPRDSLEWRRGAARRLIRPWGDLLVRWRRVGATREPRLALIVKLAQGQEPRLLEQVCARPRVILRRDRDLRPVSRVQELDPACIRWLARQPGRRVAEKAGEKQQVLGVVRIEDVDTHENRVVKDLLRRATIAARLYLREHRTHGAHERIEVVRRFEQQLRRCSRDSPIAGVGPLAGVPAPNYVLQHDPRYAPLWRAYIALLRQQMLLDSAWRWRHRIWSETVVLATLAALHHGQGTLVRSDVALHAEHVSGRFIDPTTVLGPVLWSSGTSVDVLLGSSQAMEYPGGHLRRLAPLGPDVTLVLRRERDSRPLSTVAIWGLLEFQLERDLEPWMRQLDEVLPGAVHHALIVVPAPLRPLPRTPVVSRCEVQTLPHHPQAGVEELLATLRRLLPGVDA